MKMTLMGSGTSHGLPVIGCDCPVCTSPFKKDKRFRASAYVEHTGTDGKGTHILIDCGPEFRLQALRTGIRHIDAVLLTHSHADHLHGIDDLRIFSYVKLGGKRAQSEKSAQELRVTESEGAALPLYANPDTLADVRARFAYVFGPPKLGGGMPKLRLADNTAYTATSPLVVGSGEHAVRVIPVPLLHGSLPTSGYLLTAAAADGSPHSIAYLTDCSTIPESSLALIRAAAGTLDHVVIDGLRRKPHSTHCSYEEALCYAEQLSPRNIWLTHLNHDLRHSAIVRFIRKELLPAHPALRKLEEAGGVIGPAYDGLVLSAGEPR